MNDDRTARLELPLLHSGQVHKERTHNEALALLDMLVQPVVRAVGRNDPPADAAAGECWIVGAAPIGDWMGREGHIAVQTTGGWRFAAPRTGMRAWSIADTAMTQYGEAGWTTGIIRGAAVLSDGIRVLGPRCAAVSDVVGGEVVDGAARTTIHTMLAVLREHGLIEA